MEILQKFIGQWTTELIVAIVIIAVIVAGLFLMAKRRGNPQRQKEYNRKRKLQTIIICGHTFGREGFHRGFEKEIRKYIIGLATDDRIDCSNLGESPHIECDGDIIRLVSRTGNGTEVVTGVSFQGVIEHFDLSPM